jgi:DNA-binding MarR family transcriptional regulator
MATTKTTAVAVWLNLHGLVMDHKWLSRDLLHDRTDGMPWSGYRVLRRVEDGPRSQGEIADLMGIDAPAVSGIIADLVQRGYVDRTTDPTDGRRKLVDITTGGREVLHGLRSVADVVPAPMAPLTATERRELNRLIDKMRAASDHA